MFTRIALGGIWAYQTYLSPRKGYRCAYSVAHGGTGCSGYAKHAIRDHGLWSAIAPIRQRFRDCRAAYEALRNERHDDAYDEAAEERDHNRRRRRRQNCQDACCFGAEGAAYFPSACATRAAATSASKKGVCDLNPCDGDIGCGSCDACSIDICSCG